MRRALLLLLTVIALLTTTAPACKPIEGSAHFDGPPWATKEWATGKFDWLPVFNGTPTDGILFANPDNGLLLISGTRNVNGRKPDPLLESGTEFLNEARQPGEDHLSFKQAAEHVEAKAATLARLKEFESTALVMNNPKGPCGWASRIGCVRSVSRILPSGYTMVVRWPNGSRTFHGQAK
ncbi:DddA-like double-stranded DNA deaminase toxin [Saccharopolyspora phatthalungensis]|uniref:Uncharacterized protein n=1 Tax=Saccharopolyspora phatthalungensis TaxID=664693 RepID=A0A840QHH5_9PSEU|nr:DddA-like double-stranded DNA deaminase toxin [Saccharopolyspora phatthalungensis]MBB5159450.1 hypothetical protein [Saccharopolyspora phatthalungensis]